MKRVSAWHYWNIKVSSASKTWLVFLEDQALSKSMTDFTKKYLCDSKFGSITYDKMQRNFFREGDSLDKKFLLVSKEKEDERS